MAERRLSSGVRRRRSPRPGVPPHPNRVGGGGGGGTRTAPGRDPTRPERRASSSPMRGTINHTCAIRGDPQAAGHNGDHGGAARSLFRSLRSCAVARAGDEGRITPHGPRTRRDDDDDDDDDDDFTWTTDPAFTSRRMARRSCGSAATCVLPCVSSLREGFFSSLRKPPIPRKLHTPRKKVTSGPREFI